MYIPMFTILQNNTINDLVSHHYDKHCEQKLRVKILFKSLSDTTHRTGRFKQHLGKFFALAFLKVSGEGRNNLLCPGGT